MQDTNQENNTSVGQNELAAPAQTGQAPVQPPTPVQPAVNQSQSAAPAQAPQQMSKGNPKEMFVGLLGKFKAAPKNIKMLVIVVVVFVFLVLMLLLAALVTGGGGGKVAEAPVATPTAAPSSPLPQVEISNPSRYATDSGVLKIESDVDGLSKEMDSVDLRQSNLRVPSLDFNVKFQ